MNNCLAIITARGGSKRIPRKNIRDFLGSPIIRYSIDAALNAGCFDEIMVSTEDFEIADLAVSLGANVPFMRSNMTSNDYATTADVTREVLKQYKFIGKEFKYCCCLYPTAPFITSEKLSNAYLKLIESDADSVVTVVRYGFPIQRSFSIEKGILKMNWPKYLNTRSQDLPPAYYDAGQFYFLRTESFLKKKEIFTDFTIGLELPESEVQDIDVEKDWEIAELKYKLLQAKL